MVFFIVAVCLVAAIGLLGLANQRGNDAGTSVISRHDEVFELPPGALPGAEGATTRPPACCPSRWVC